MKKNQRKQPTNPTPQQSVKKANSPSDISPLLWALGVCTLTAMVFFPMLSNGFTNWDDQLYITENALLRGPDWSGIFSKAVVSNYHPLTVASLALNYQFSKLSPFSYHIVDWLLHILNTGLVFYFAFRLSGNQRWVAVITALLFGIHPMHVESVAWASERKDLLYTFFFLSSLLVYLQYLQQESWKKYTVALGLFALSLLSKPAAVTLPVVLLLLDWYQGRSLKDKKVWLEKLPFFGLALAFGLLTLQIQAEKAIANPEYYPLWQRMVFACYGFGAYLKGLVWPFPLSAIHPFPDAGVVPTSYYPALLIALGSVVAAWYFRKRKYIVLGIGFFAVNVVLVLQLLAFGNAVIAERYTYVPYIGLAYALAMTWANNTWPPATKNVVLGLFLLAGLGFAVSSNRQVRVWKNSQTLWTKAIEAYPNSYVARSNRGNDLVTNFQQYDEALIDYNIALEVEPNHAHSLENRTIIYLHKQNFEAAMIDAESFVKFHPDMPRAYLLRAFTADKLKKTDQAIADYGKCIELDPQNEEPRGNRGVIYYNSKQDFRAAKDDFDAGCRLNPKKGVNFVNRARCWVKFGNKAEALKDIETAKKLREGVDAALEQAAQALK